MSAHAWFATTVGQIADLSTGTTPPTKNSAYFGGEINWYTPQDVVDQLYLVRSERKITDLAKAEKKARLFEKGTILMTAIGNIGRLGILAADASANQQITGIRLNTDAVDIEFLFFWLLGHRREIVSKASQATLPIINQEKIKEIFVSYPDLEEQRRIVARVKECMERVKEVDLLRAESVQEANAVLPSVFHGVFEVQARTATVNTIGALAVETRYGTSEKCHTESQGIPVLRIPNVAQGKVNFGDLKYCDLSKDDLSRLSLVDGDLLFVRTNGSRDLVGRSAVFASTDDQQVFAYASYLIRVRLDQQQVLPQYLSYFLNSTKGREEIDKRRRTSAGQFNINSENLRTIPLPVPSIAKQRSILAQLQERETVACRLIESLTESDVEAGLLRESILRKAFAGEL